jgi:hypothetical protein
MIHAQYTLYNHAYFAGLIFVDCSLSVKLHKLDPLKISHYRVCICACVNQKKVVVHNFQFMVSTVAIYDFKWVHVCYFWHMMWVSGSQLFQLVYTHVSLDHYFYPAYIYMYNTLAWHLWKWMALVTRVMYCLSNLILWGMVYVDVTACSSLLITVFH